MSFGQESDDCSVIGCVRPVIKKHGLCRTHLYRLRSHGNTGPAVGNVARGRTRWPLERRFCSKLIWTSTCVEWTGTKNEKGYGRIVVGGKRLYAHRLSYELFVGPIDSGLTIDHLCENHACVWPQHLEVVTRAENARRHAERHRATHCPRGHEYTVENTLIDKHGWRSCRQCSNERKMKSYYRKTR